MHAEAVPEEEKKADGTLAQSKSFKLMASAADELKVERADSIRNADV